MMQKKRKKNGGYFSYLKNNQNRFQKCLYLSEIMRNYSNYFLDTIIVDATYKRNLFDFILVNLIGFNNHGQNIMLEFELLTEETTDAYDWLFKSLKEAWIKKQPNNFICDESD